MRAALVVVRPVLRVVTALVRPEGVAVRRAQEEVRVGAMQPQVIPYQGETEDRTDRRAGLVVQEGRTAAAPVAVVSIRPADRVAAVAEPGTMAGAVDSKPQQPVNPEPVVVAVHPIPPARPRATSQAAEQRPGTIRTPTTPTTRARVVVAER